MNQNPEQLARDRIDQQLTACGWMVQNKSSINLHAGTGVAVREYKTDVGPADYILFVDKKPVGIIEAKRAEEGVHLTMHEEQSLSYAESKLKFLNNGPLPFVYESTGEVTRFTDYRDPKPRSRNDFTFHRSDAMANINQADSIIRLNENVNPKYLSFFLNSNSARSYYNLNKVDVARANLSLKDVSEIEISLPLAEEQNPIVEELEGRLSVADKLEETIAISLQQIESLRQSILKKAFKRNLPTAYE